ncbi:hypothetical protein Pcinc_029805 [Petrolisthes cinctipes]|uniref:Uncharacterized protein n=1 Tax=Petrolisthes cinctipes TaxID=88211 RepID=A0AAE1EZL8_PETCI|nr:hypothetical protein Pcinc_029805 [Petrolisthes cinctipes]
MGDNKKRNEWILKSTLSSGDHKRSSSVEILVRPEDVNTTKLIPSRSINSAITPSTTNPVNTTSTTPITNNPSTVVSAIVSPTSNTTVTAPKSVTSTTPSTTSTTNVSTTPSTTQNIPTTASTNPYSMSSTAPSLRGGTSLPYTGPPARYSNPPSIYAAPNLSSSNLFIFEPESPTMNRKFHGNPNNSVYPPCFYSPYKPPETVVNMVPPQNNMTMPVSNTSTPVNPSQPAANVVTNPVAANPSPIGIPRRCSNPTAGNTNEVTNPQAANPNEAPTNPPLRSRLQRMARVPPLTPLMTKKGMEHSSPLGTPIIGSMGHVFCVSTPEVDPENPQALPPLPSTPMKKKPIQECVGDPFDQKRKAMATGSEEGGERGTGGSEDRGGDEPVWQRRLSQLFVPPSDSELQNDKEPEETSLLLPKSTPPLVKKTSHPHTPPTHRDSRKDSSKREVKEKQKRDSKEIQRWEDSSHKRENKDQRWEWEEEKEKEREEVKEKEREREESIERQRKKGRNESDNSFSDYRGDKVEKERLKDEEDLWQEKRWKERSQPLGREERTKRSTTASPRKPKTSRIFFQDDEYDINKRKESDEDIPHFGKWDPESNSDESRRSSSPAGLSEEEEAGGDDYTSWDDTICSNRSSYFKMYYNPRGIIGKSEEKENRLKAALASSHNSLSSLIREKMGSADPNGGKKTRGDIGLMLLVAVLFIIIVVGISLTTYFYKLHLLELSIFNRLKFLEDPRHLKIYAPGTWEEMLTAHFGSNLPPHSLPHECTNYLLYLEKHNRSLPHHLHTHEDYEDMFCLDWIGLAQLQLLKHPAQDDFQCYTVVWAGENEDFTLRDCLLASGEYGTWWGGGEMTSGGYPITNARVPPTPMVTGKLGRDSWGQLLRHTWLSNTSSLLTLPKDFHGTVSVNHDSSGEVCLETKPNPIDTPATPTMMYKLCTAANLTSLVQHLHYEAVGNRRIVAEATGGLVKHIANPVGKVVAGKIIENRTSGKRREEFKEEVLLRVEERVKHPVWIPWMTPDRPQLTQEAVLKYVDGILEHDFGFWGHILLPPSWQARPGDLVFDAEYFPDPIAMVQKIKLQGFRLALTIHPFVSVETPYFNTGTQEGLWVRQKNSPLPALAQYDEQHPSVIVDFSNSRSKQWFSTQLENINLTYSIDRFHLQPADAHALPAFHEYHMKLPGPDSVLIHFMAAVTRVSLPISTEGTVTPPLPPTFLSLGTGDGSWTELETLVPRVLTLTMLGYPLIDVGPIGGLARAGYVPERELYIRWMEAATFFPAYQVSVLPNIYDEEVTEMAHEYNEIRLTMVIPRYLSQVKEAVTKGTPLVTPLALFAPDDSTAAQISDQFVVGDDLLVAPVSHRGERTRNIYLPQGIWKDRIDGHLRLGGRWLNNYNVPLTKIPHFTLEPVDDFTR